jgi:hypothetical protein
VNQEITLDTPQLRGLAYPHALQQSRQAGVCLPASGSDIIDYDKLPKPQWLQDLTK